MLLADACWLHVALALRINYRITIFEVFPKNGLFAKPEGRLGRYSPDDEDLITKFAQLFPLWQCRPRFGAQRPFVKSRTGGEPNSLV